MLPACPALASRTRPHEQPHAFEAAHGHYPAQQDSCLTSFEKVCAASFSPSTMVRYGKS